MVHLLANARTLEPSFQVEMRVSHIPNTLLLSHLSLLEEGLELRFIRVLPELPALIVLTLDRHGPLRDKVGRLEGLIDVEILLMAAFNERTNVVTQDLHVVLLVEDAIFPEELAGKGPDSEGAAHGFLGA